MSEERLQKVLAQAGVASRRACEEWIQAGRVTVNGLVVTELGSKVDTETSEIRVDGKKVAVERLRYLMLNKPSGYLSGPDPKSSYPTWHDLVRVRERLYAAGRLDQDSEGLMLLTNDGDLALRLSHPRFEHPKTYLVQVEGFPNPRKIRRWQHGVMLDDGPTLPAHVTLLKQPPSVDVIRPVPTKQVPERGAGREPVQPGRSARPRASWLKFTLREGRKRQLRRMVALLGHPAMRIIRIGLGPLELGDLPPGKWRDLTPGEVKTLLAAASRARAAGFAAEEAAGARELERMTELQMPSTIAIDGPSASGKSTIGGLLAERLGYLYFDTGVMYRAVAAVALARKVPVGDESAVTALAEQIRLEILAPVIDDGRDVTVLADGLDITWDIRQRAVEKAVSPVSAYQGVRRAMVLQQRRIGEQGKVVMVGRDIGTAVMPEADLKIYLDATLAERARRRYLERRERGEQVEQEQVLIDVRRRDEYDASREHSPLRSASDAVIVDSTGLSIDQVLERVYDLVKSRKRRVAA